MRKRRIITLAQVDALERQLTQASAVAPKVETSAPIRYKRRRSDRVDVIGTTDQYLQTSSMTIAQGRFFSPVEVTSGRAVCVIGCEVATNLFQREPPLGKKITIGQRSYEVVGILEKQGKFLGMFSLDNQVFIPLKQLVAFFWGNPDYEIQVKVKDLALLPDTREEVRNVMRTVRRLAPNDPDDFAINQQDPLVKMFHKMGGTIAAVGVS